jgi:UDP-3-O-acyl-N-acetylglucosamine deacetylase
VQENLRLSTRLESPEAPEELRFVGTVEHLLSALEAGGIDNARIEAGAYTRPLFSST